MDIKFIYFKSRKVAGTSTEILLSDLVGNEDIVTPITKGDSSTHKPRNYNGFINHSSPLYIKNKIGEDKFDSYFKFITVRNPFDRAVSWYFWQKSVKETNKNFKDFILSKGCNPLTSFSDWIFLEKEYYKMDQQLLLTKSKVSSIARKPEYIVKFLQVAGSILQYIASTKERKGEENKHQA